MRDVADVASRDAWVRGLTRPHAALFWLYAARSLLAGPLLPVAFLVLFFKYHTLRYTFGEEGVTVSSGILFYKESTVSYRKIQDIHVRRSFLERWLGIGTVDVQTASGSASAEIELEGVTDHEAVRDFLYRRMRGLEPEARAEDAAGAVAAGAAEDEVVGLLRSIKDELDRTRQALEAKG